MTTPVHPYEQREEAMRAWQGARDALDGALARYWEADPDAGLSHRVQRQHAQEALASATGALGGLQWALERDGEEAVVTEPEDVPLRLVPCALILRPGAGATVQGAFANARALAAVTAHAVIVEGNDVQVVVRPGMSDAACQQAYEDALDPICPRGAPGAGAGTAGAAMSAERDALIAALVAEYVAILRHAGIWGAGGHTDDYRFGGREALDRVARGRGVPDLRARAAELVACGEQEEGP